MPRLGHSKTAHRSRAQGSVHRTEVPSPLIVTDARKNRPALVRVTSTTGLYHPGAAAAPEPPSAGKTTVGEEV
jgi:hypothetical protein